MHIRTKRIGKIDMTVEQKKTFTILSEHIEKIEKKSQFQNKIGAELVIGRHMQISKDKASWIQLNISAFDSPKLSEFISELMASVAGLNLNCIFSSKNIEGFTDPVFTNIIIL
jgi:hypothetical protein